MSYHRHGHSSKAGGSSRTYRIWRSMKTRCENPKHDSYRYYGGDGVTVCPEWSDFVTFLADMGEAPEGMSLDREEGAKVYCKENCRWATPTEQASNRRNTVVVLVDGVPFPLKHAAKKFGMTYRTVQGRLERGWSIEQALLVPAKTKAA